MAYRPLSRVLGETSLERKCLFFFGISLALLICGAFLYVERVTEELVWDQTRIRGQRSVDLSMTRFHYEAWESMTDPGVTRLTDDGASKEPPFAEVLKVVNDDLPTQDYEWRIIALNLEGRMPNARPGSLRLYQNEDEKEVLQDLEEELRQELEERELARANAAAEQDADSEQHTRVSAEELPVPVHRMVPVDDKLYYYQPVYWKPSCTRLCHGLGFRGGHAVSAADAASFVGTDPPLRVVRIEIPRADVQHAISKSRAVLLATAIITVFFSVVALYLVVKRVVVKPLNHLREVSDEISRGNNDLRAEINTNDEFEDLAASFNRMLRHLVDAQQALQNANVDLDGKVDQLAQANLQLHEMNRLKSEFLANMSHELRTPLNSILGFSDVLQSIDSLDEKQKKYVLRIRESGGTLLDMINDILDLAKMESGKMEVKLSEFSVATIINAQCDILRSLAEEKNIDLLVEIEADLPPMFQDQSKLQQILMNLLSNAIKFTPEGGRITVSARQDSESFLCLSVEDTGIGIPEEDRPIIFEKFRQARGSNGDDNLIREFSGTGLGLSIVKELCRLLGGMISYQSDLGKGSLFTARLPWNLPEPAPRDTDLALRLEEATKPRRLDYQRLSRAAGDE